MIQKIKKLRNYANKERIALVNKQYRNGTYSRDGGDNAQQALAHLEQELDKLYEELCEAQCSPAVIIKM